MRTHFLFNFSIRIMIGSFLLASLISGFAVAHYAVGTTDHNVKNDTAESRTIGQYMRDKKAFMKLSKNDDPQLKRNAVYNLCKLHHELVQDKRFQTSKQIQGLRATIAKRLQNYAAEVKTAKKRAERDKKKQKSAKTKVASDSDSAPNAETGFANRLPESHADEDDGSDLDDEMFATSSDSHFVMGQFTGGPNQFFGYAGGQFASPWDHGEELLGLIESTVNPSHWRRNGGNGSIEYFRPLRVLVIGASMQVQDDTLNLLNTLRSNR